MANDANFNFYLNRQGPRGQRGEKGDQGFSPSITVNSDTADEYTLLIQNEYDSFVTDNIRPTYDDRGGTYVRVDRANNVQYFGSADIATTANYGEVKLATEDDVATGSTTDDDSNVVTAGILKGVKANILADTVTLTTAQTITGFKTFDKGLYANNIIQARGELSYYSPVFNKKVFEAVNDSVTINGSLAVDGDVTFYGNINTASDVRANFQSITAKSIKVNNKDVATADTVDAIQSDLNIAKQDIIEAQGDIDNLQMNKQNKLTAGSGITIDADNVISATGGVVDLPIASSATLGGIKVGENLTISEDGTLSATGGGGGGTSIDDSTISSTSTWSSSKINSEINTVANEVVQVQGNVASLDELTSTMSSTINQKTTLQQGTPFTLNLTANGTLGGSTPACTGSSYETGHPYYYAFKGATSSTPTKELWGPSSAADNQYLILDCVTPIALQSFRWTNGGNSQERFPTIVFKGSNDNSSYTTLGTYNTQNATDDSVTIENYTPYRYYRFDFPTHASYGKLGFISMSGFNRYNILNIGDGLDVINGQLTCTPSDAPVTGVSAPLKLSGDTVNVPEMTGPTTEGFTVTASRFSAMYSSQYYKCFNADGNGWYAGSQESGSDYIQIVFPRLLHLRSAYIKQNNNTNSLVSNYTLLITQNGTDWTEVLSDKLPQTTNYKTSKIINSNCLGFRFRADGNYATNGAAIRGIILDLTELPTTATLGYDDNFVLDGSNQLSLNSAKFGKLSSPILDVPVNNCVLAMPTAPTFDGTNVKVYAGTKVAIPNGLNADGTCKSNIVTLTTDATINQSTFNGDVTLMLKSDGTIDQTAYSYFEVDDISTITTLTASCWYYDRKTNNHYLASSEGAKQGPYQRIKIGSYNQATNATTKYFRTYKPIALEKLDITGSCMPDYTRPLTFTPNVVATAAFDCWLCGQFNVDQNKNSTIKFYNSAGTVIKAFDIASGSGTNRRFHNIPLPKGTIYEVSVSTVSYEAYIYPCIGGMINA